MDKIIEHVRCTIADHLYVHPESLTASTTLMKDLELDSLDVVEICIALETLFDVEIDVEQAHQFITVFDIAAFLRGRVAPRDYQEAA